MNKLLCLLTVCWLIAPKSQGQSFRFRATVDTVLQSGFHRIALPPSVVGRLSDNLTDIRLYDNQKLEVPYLLTRQQPVQTAPFMEYEVVSRTSRPDVSTMLIVRNQQKNRINSLGIVIKNTNVGKKARLSGSADAQNWYAIDNAIWLAPTQTSGGTTDTKLLHFPLSDYGYYRLEINDSLSAPLNILKVGNYTPMALAGTYSPIPGITISQRDSSDKHSYIHLTRNSPARLDKLVLLVQSTMPYRRRAEIGRFISRKPKRGLVSRQFELIRTFELSSADSNTVYLPSLKTNDLYIVIANDDNPPLRTGNIRAYQLTTYLLANLTAGQSYQLRFASETASAPVYDLAPFQTNVPANPPVIGVKNSIDTQVTEYSGSVFRGDSQLIWLAIGIVVALLGFLSYRMLHDMGTTNAKNP